MLAKRFAIVIAIVFAVLLLSKAIYHLKSHNIDEANLEEAILKRLSDEGCEDHYKILMADEKYRCRVIFFTAGSEDKTGIAFFTKGINNKYRLTSLPSDRNLYFTAHRHYFKVYLVTAGSRKQKNINYIGIRTKKGKTIKRAITGDYFIEFIEDPEHINFYDKTGGKIMLDSLWY